MRSGSTFVKLFIIIVVLTMLLLAAVRARLIVLPPHYDPFTPPDLAEEPYWLTSTKLKLLDFDPQACSAAIQKAGLDGFLLPRTDASRACHLESTIMLARFSRARVNAEQTRCNIAARLYMWERHVVQPAAKKYFGQSVKEIAHFGSYSCRTIHNSSSMSEHATANAFDISGFRLANGKLISILKDWPAGGPRAEFLREIRDGACHYFNLVLSPDYNADHANHFHVDMGWVGDCR